MRNDNQNRNPFRGIGPLVMIVLRKRASPCLVKDDSDTNSSASSIAGRATPDVLLESASKAAARFFGSLGVRKAFNLTFTETMSRC